MLKSRVTKDQQLLVGDGSKTFNTNILTENKFGYVKLQVQVIIRNSFQGVVPYIRAKKVIYDYTFQRCRWYLWYTTGNKFHNYIISTLIVGNIYNSLRSGKFPSRLWLGGDPKWVYNKRNVVPVCWLSSHTSCLTFQVVSLFTHILFTKSPSQVRLGGDPKWVYNKLNEVPVWWLRSNTSCITFHTHFIY